MAKGTERTILQHTRQIIYPTHGTGVTDAQLLARYLSARDDAAFELLVRRHGGMVLSVCERVLQDAHAAEDAFQATFLTLVRKARAIGNREALGSWLYKVAFRAALRLKDRAAQRHIREKPLEDLVLDVCYKPDDELAWKELRALLDAEVNRLPEKYRTVFILCYLQGKTNEQAAEQLGCPKGTVLSRLARARERLRARMSWRGLAFGPGSFATLLAQRPLSASTLPAELIRTTVHGAGLVFQGQAAAGTVSASVVELMEATVRDLSMARKAVVAAVIAGLLLVVAGAGAFAYSTGMVGPGSMSASSLSPGTDGRASVVGGPCGGETPAEGGP